MSKYVERHEDMSPLGRLRVFQQDDGDMIIAIVPDPNANSWERGSVEFCTKAGGGRSPRTRKAIQDLMLAIEKDNAENPDPRAEPTE